MPAPTFAPALTANGIRLMVGSISGLDWMEARRRLESQVGEATIVEEIVGPWVSHSESFLGQVSDQGFELRPVVTYRGPAPVLVGEWDSDRATMVVEVVFPLILPGACVAGFVFVGSKLFGPWSGVGAGIFVMLTFLQLVVSEGRRSFRRLSEILNAR